MLASACNTVAATIAPWPSRRVTDTLRLLAHRPASARVGSLFQPGSWSPYGNIRSALRTRICLWRESALLVHADRNVRRGGGVTLEVQRGRYTADIDGDFVVFLIGMRLNHPLRIRKWWPVATAMPRMLTSTGRQVAGRCRRSYLPAYLAATESAGEGTRPGRQLAAHLRRFRGLAIDAVDASRTAVIPRKAFPIALISPVTGSGRISAARVRRSPSG